MPDAARGTDIATSAITATAISASDAATQSGIDIDVEAADNGDATEMQHGTESSTETDPYDNIDTSSAMCSRCETVNDFMKCPTCWVTDTFSASTIGSSSYHHQQNGENADAAGGPTGSYEPMQVDVAEVAPTTQSVADDSHMQEACIRRRRKFASPTELDERKKARFARE